MGKRDAPGQDARRESAEGGKVASASTRCASSSIDDIFGSLGAASAARAKRTAKPSAAARPDSDGKSSKSGSGARAPKGARTTKGTPPAERAVPSAFTPPSRAERTGWVDDGLGGVHDGEGWTGRRTEEGMRIFKTRLLQPTKKKVSGGTPLCPFDCDCCYV
ncbi:hypothetical protein KFE25_001457 [Diacronema lutheri]|uniref:Uncharacterized protein n=2 Tax=Diacronema lutheri TaxID=2081491 RepID=A0A8J6C3R4_DIALT|nr:hypothetical protein KFE25_001457 [Diacronema lutheri]